MRSVYGTFTKENWTIEYTIHGEGIPLLMFHGGHSSCFEEAGYQPLIDSGFSVITPSRAGYGGTSASIVRTLQEACRAYEALLQHLKVGRVHVVAASAGGPTGIAFSAAFPELVRSLTLQSAVTKEWLKPEDRTYKAARILFHPKTEKYTWQLIASLSSLFPRFMLKQMFSSFSLLTYAEASDRIGRGDHLILSSMNRRQRSGEGFLIDLEQTKMITVEQLEAISSPVLIMHSRFDSSVPVEHAQHAASHIPHTAVELLDSWGHIIWLGDRAEEVDEKLLAFLKDHEQKL
ncbi:alpha/beta fold hydrolase [Alkalicoccus saliphilus]|uniref:Alpha/beta hydrolase n=1 Tax=Alkalicoccus saliphilus TaxID=200989 RepID=A0A2T4U3U4_9BACI|nr:alpha/beta hydrolase [Alkalicoccus saliphilus]PTL38074.1 alpha/beta hydrolase [Alkalicoccus saliphilus]